MLQGVRSDAAASKRIAPQVIAHRYFRGAAAPGRVFDMACGHGFVAHLVAASHDVQVVGVDLERRDAFDAWATAFRAQGLAAATCVERDLTEVALRRDDLVFAIHACDDANIVVVDHATRAGAQWLVVPCCLKADNYLDVKGDRRSSRSRTANLADDQRYALLCGALAAKFGATLTSAIDHRVTRRNVVLAGGDAEAARTGGDADAAHALRPARGRLPTFRGPHVR